MKVRLTDDVYPLLGLVKGTETPARKMRKMGTDGSGKLVRDGWLYEFLNGFGMPTGLFADDDQVTEIG